MGLVTEYHCSGVLTVAVGEIRVAQGSLWTESVPWVGRGAALLMCQVSLCWLSCHSLRLGAVRARPYGE